jgi:mannose-6-phosphate isomerase
MQALYPLRFKEILRDYEFGGRWIAEEFAKKGLPDGHRLAETWEVCDRPGESSVVMNGELSGRTLHELIETHGEALLGRAVTALSGLRFPLLIKLLDATNPLGEQIHPDDSLARELGLEDSGKTEAWYMLRTQPGATIHCGARGGIGRTEVLNALINDTIRDIMEERAVRSGDAFLLHAGAMHYSRGGVLFYEIMQNSDVTIALRNRELLPGTESRKKWAEKTLKGVRTVGGSECKIQPVTIASGMNRVSYIFACRYFALERLDLASTHEIACTGARFYVLTQIEGEATITSDSHTEKLSPGQSCLLPASLGKVVITPSGRCTQLSAYAPDLVRDVIQPLRKAGIHDASIIDLGGEASCNPLVDLIGKIP